MVFAVPIYDDNPIQRSPVVTYALIGTCIGAWLWQIATDPETSAYLYGMVPAALFGYLPPGSQPIPSVATIFTSMFLHGGWIHLGSNMLFLWIFGNNMEDLLGRGRYLVLYLASGVAAALVQALSAKYSAIPMVGASGAVAGVLGAYLVTYPRANVHCLVWIVIFFWIVTVPAWILLGFWFVMQLFSGLVSGAGSPGVAFWAHVGGFAAGTVLYLVVRPRRVRVLQPQRTPVWTTMPPGALGGHRLSHRGSVPDSGRDFPRPRSPWG